MRCSKCNKEIDENFTHCPYCGKQVNEKRKKSKILDIVFWPISVCIILFGLMILWAEPESKNILPVIVLITTGILVNPKFFEIIRNRINWLPRCTIVLILFIGFIMLGITIPSNDNTKTQSSVQKNSSSGEIINNVSKDTSINKEKCEHEYEWTIVQEPTYTEYGKKEGVCTKCGAVIKYSIDKLIEEDKDNKEDKNINQKVKLQLGDKVYANLENATKECNMDILKISGLYQIDGWQCGNRYSFKYNDTLGTELTMAVYDTGEIANIICGNTKIYDINYESLNIDDYYVDYNLKMNCVLAAENFIEQTVTTYTSPKYNFAEGVCYKYENYVVITGTMSAKNAFGQKMTYDCRVDMILNDSSITPVYVVVGGQTMYGSEKIPEIERNPRKEKIIIGNLSDVEENAIILSYNVECEYSEKVKIDGIDYIFYCVPAGKYEVTCLNKGSGFFVTNKTDENDIIAEHTFMQKDEKVTVEIPNNYYITLVVNSNFKFVPVN